MDTRRNYSFALSTATKQEKIFVADGAGGATPRGAEKAYGRRQRFNFKETNLRSSQQSACPTG
jgi:hypothetical protein